MLLHAVFPSIKLSSIVFMIIPSVPKYVNCLTYILFLATITITDLSNQLYCGKLGNDCSDICMNPPFFPKDRVSLEPNSYSIYGATKRHHGL